MAPATRTAAILSRPLRFTVLLLAVVPGLTVRSATAQAPRAYVEKVAGTLVTFEMMPVPAGTVQRSDTSVNVAPFWMMKTEVTWDLFDVFVFELDKADSTMAGRAADAVARPSKPYVLPGDAFGHAGYPALGMSLYSARQFAHWLSAKTGHAYRLPTDAEWVHACRLGAGPAGTARRPLSAHAWHAANAGDATHPAGRLAPDALGLHDMLGNVAEWTTVAADSGVIGGEFATRPEQLTCETWAPQTRAWNETDPQLPKSRWWLTDAFFVGLRLVRTVDS